MSFENPENIIRSWNLQGSFSNSQVVEDKLVPKRWQRIRTVHLKTWREEQLNSTIDWGVKGFSYFLPESLRVVSSMFLEINLPALDASQAQRYKAYPGLYAIKELRFLSAGTEAYKVQPELLFWWFSLKSNVCCLFPPKVCFEYISNPKIPNLNIFRESFSRKQDL